MRVVTQSSIWKGTLSKAAAGTTDPDPEFRERLRQAFINFRKHAGLLAREIPQDLPLLTVHDETHTDALWQLTDMIIGPGYPISPTEAFILGGAFLLHDLGMALASYPAGMADLERDPGWQDAAVQLFRRAQGRYPSAQEMGSLDLTIRQGATEQLLRLRHAQQAERLATIEYRHAGRDQVYHLIEDDELRDKYGVLIGRIAHSHWWPAEELSAQFNATIGAYPGAPADWTIDPLKLALIVRVADACHLDSRRAPGFLRALRKPTGEAEKHWRFQEYIQTPHVSSDRLVFTATKAIPLEDIEAWWLLYDMISQADRELRDASAILTDSGRQTFAVDAVAGANEPTRLRRFFPTMGWEPVPTALRVSDVAGLVRNLGGQGLYGQNPRVPLRELIQNARDAVVGRRIKEAREKSWGEIFVRLIARENGHEIEVHDSGLGMSAELLSGPFLDFGTSYWNSSLMLREHPGLVSRGFEPQGQFGIGFFSIFMWGEYVKVVTRRPEDGIEATRVLDFVRGLSGRPVLRLANAEERLKDPGTIVRVRLDHPLEQVGGILGPGPIESRFGFPVVVRREKPWTLNDLCAWLCPAIDVNLYVEQDGKRTAAVTASDWEGMDATDLLRRLLLHLDDVESTCADDFFRAIAANLREIRDESGRLLGRAALRHAFLARVSREDWLHQASAITAGAFRAHEQIHMPGLLLGRPQVASRVAARPIAFACPTGLSNWATVQADLIPNLTREPTVVAHHAGLIRLLGGDTRDLPIARSAAGFVSFRDIAKSRDLSNEILLLEEQWGSYLVPNLPDNGFAVGMGRMKALFDDLFEYDPRKRANHPRWDQYWMSLWGATIEAIAQAWGVPLQQVLEASDIASKRKVDTSAKDFETFMGAKVDIIRNPYGGQRTVETA
jgi:hypothetical protein